jgi:hypothetical protein
MLWREQKKQFAKEGKINWRTESKYSWPSAIDEGTEDRERYTLK